MIAVITRRFNAAAVTALFVVSIASGIFPAIASAVDPITLGGVSSISGLRGSPISLSGLTISGTGTTSIQLRASHGQIELTNTSGVTVSGSNPASTISYSGTVANITASFAHLTYTASSTGSDTIEVSTVGEGQVYYPGNGHVYQVIEYDMDPGDGAHGIDWDTSRSQAITKNYQGLTGYLATITSAEENEYVSARLGQAGWMGASDSATEDDWKWVGGPENGTSFWSGDMSGSPVSGRYSNWGDGEPNNAGDEDCTQFLSGGTGQWNDLPCAGNYLPAYVVEFGGPGNLPTVATKNIGVTVSAPIHTVSSCQDLADLSTDSSKNSDTINLTADIDCLGATVEPIFSYYGFNGTFNGQGHTIRNFNIDALNGSYSEYGWAGLFMYSDGGIFKNLTIEGGTVSGYDRVGGLLGDATNVSIENVHSSMEVVGQGEGVGGLVGYITDTSPGHFIRTSSVTGATSGNSGVGGLVGSLSAVGSGTIEIEETFTTGDVTASGSNVGGMFGMIGAEGCCSTDAVVDIHDVYAQGDVTGGDSHGNGSVGGLIGHLLAYEDGAVTRATISRAYASGDVEGGYYVGGLIGNFFGPNNDEVIDEVSMSFASGRVVSLDADTTGALVGLYEDNGEPMTWSENYFDQTRIGLSNCFGSGGDAAGSCNARNAANSQSDYFFKKANNPMPDWDFNDIWVAHANTWPTFDGTNPPDDGDDADGIPALVEAAAPNAGDANNDGTADSDQPNVSSFLSAVTSKYVSLAVSNGCNTTEASVTSEISKTSQDSGYDYPGGLLGFTTVCGSAGSTATISQYYYGVSADGLLARKYNPVTRAYFMVPGAIVSSVTIGGQTATKVVYQITDGGLLDTDGIANGTIVDPAGPASSVVGTPNTGVRPWQDILLKK